MDKYVEYRPDYEYFTGRIENNGPAPLYAPMVARDKPQPAYLEIDACACAFDWCTYTDGVMPPDVWNGLIVRVPVNPLSSRRALMELMTQDDRFRRAVHAILDAMRFHRNYQGELIGTLTDEGKEKCAWLEGYMEGRTAGDALSYCEARELMEGGDEDINKWEGTFDDIIERVYRFALDSGVIALNVERYVCEALREKPGDPCA